MPRARWLACAVLISSLMSGRALAQTDADTPAEAVEFYRQAREHYEAGEYRQAADDLERALMLDPDSPTLVYNLARVYELLGEPQQALARYEQYQTLLPRQQAREQEDAATTIRRLQGAAASARPEQELASPQQVAPLRQLPGLVLVRENGVADGVFWGTLVGGGVLLLAGGAFGGIAIDARNRANDFVIGTDNPLAERDGLASDAEGFAIAADIALGVGAAGVIAAGLLYFLREHTVERSPVGARETDADGGPEASLDLLGGPGLIGARVGVRL